MYKQFILFIRKTRRNTMKKTDKTTFGKKREIEFLGMVAWSDYHGKSGCSGQKHAFNIFLVAFIGHGCPFCGSQMRHLSGTDAPQIMLKCRFYRRRETPSFGKSLAFNTLQKAPKLAYFRPKDYLFAKPPAILALFVTFS